METPHVIAVLFIAALIAAGFFYTLRRLGSVEAGFTEIQAGLTDIKEQLRRANEEISRTQGNMAMSFDRLAHSSFRQLEALYGVHLDLGLKKSLPPTRRWAASPDILKQLATFALQARPMTIVERWAREFPTCKRGNLDCEKGCVFFWASVPAPAAPAIHRGAGRIGERSHPQRNDVALEEGLPRRGATG